MIDLRDPRAVASVIDQTNLNSLETIESLVRFAIQAAEYGFRAVVVLPHAVRYVKEAVGDSIRVCTVVGFPLGSEPPEVKELEARRAVEDGADEVDMVIDVGRALEGDFGAVADEVRRVKEAAGGRVVKAIIETPILGDPDLIARVAEAVVEGGADYVKTSTGYKPILPRSTTPDDVRAMKEAVKGRAKVKAAGGIDSLRKLKEMLEAGADIVGSSSGLKIVREAAEGGPTPP